MKSFLFDLGNSNEGPIGLCARVVAQNEAAALEKLRAALPGGLNVESDGIDHDEEYIRVYLNPSNITVKDITEIESDMDTNL